MPLRRYLRLPRWSIGLRAASIFPAPSCLVVAGVILALVPGLPRIALPPNLVLLVFLPPLIYYAAFGMSWQAFRDNLREISLLAVGCVVFTTIVVAAAAHWLIGLPWPVAFVLGAIVSPPDVVAPLAIARRLGVPSRITAVLEGEGLVNDATALVLFKFALTAVLTGVFLARGSDDDICSHCRQRNAVGVRRWLGDVALALLGQRAAHRSHAVAIDAFPSVLDPARCRRIGCSCHGDRRFVCRCQRYRAHTLEDATAGNILLGFRHLSR